MERGKTESQGKSDAKEIVVGQDRGAAAQLRAERLQKADSLRQIGVNPYCNTFKPSETLTELRARYGDHDPDSLRALGETFAVAGRLVALRRMGKASFWRLQEGDTQLQVYLRRDDLGEESYERLRLFDRGDIVGVRGTLMKTKTGEFTLAAVSVVMLTKALQGLPDKWHGLTDVQQRYRQRYVDLIVNPDARRIALARCLVVQKLRRFLDDRGFVEVETPVLVGEAGGAEARPFRTHHNALDQDFVLRIATELHLKRLVVGGMHRVYEVGRLFRNEGVSTRHNPEFTSVEFYQAYATHEDLMHLTEHLLSHLVAQLRAQGLATSDQEQQTPFQIPFRRASIARLVAEHLQMGEVETDQLEHITSVAQALRLACGRTVTPQ
ncbi:MAG: amino acid--tRNA ligase-related protein, partial [Myxococcota bacterium]